MSWTFRHIDQDPSYPALKIIRRLIKKFFIDNGLLATDAHADAAARGIFKGVWLVRHLRIRRSDSCHRSKSGSQSRIQHSFPVRHFNLHATTIHTVNIAFLSAPAIPIAGITPLSQGYPK
ncbi:MAG: hypothetical protein HYU57_08940 [Micavibrio aeruginosavorus]|nr:hypothetical protein [Micavibrio aeruginosavorus]